MRRFICSHLPALLFCGIASLTSVAANEPSRDSSRPTAMRIFPERLTCTSSDVWYVNISGVCADGSESDLTRAARWSSSDVDVVDVQDGRVIPVGNGEAAITAVFGELQASAHVQVTNFDTPRKIEFRSDVIGALSRGGCNQGACHGSPQGKNGFRLSLRGFDPDVGYSELTRDLYGRRVNAGDPAGSLVLLKATGQVPHAGGRRFQSEAPALRALTRWIEQGCHDSETPRTLTRLEVHPSTRRLHESSPEQQLIVHAHYADGNVQDVTDYAVFAAAEDGGASVTDDGLVRFESTAASAVLVRFLERIETVPLTYIEQDDDFEFTSPPVANFIDEAVFSRQRELQLQPTMLVGDAVFLRRVYLDITGGIPTPEDARAFLDSSDPEKRPKLVDQLLETSEYAAFQALHWADVMRGNRETITERGVHNFHRYLVANFAADRPFIDTASDILNSLGNTIH
ncbi:MAG: DUF1549 domain-containing protein, partial [Planctomycetaceae bacterium]